MPPLFLILIDGAIVALVVLAGFAIARQIQAGGVLRRRLGTPLDEGTPLEPGTVVRAERPKNPVLAWIQRVTLSDPKERQTIRRDLALAGFESPSAPAIYVVVRFALAAGLPIGFLIFQHFANHPLTGFKLFGATALLCGAGLIAPRALSTTGLAPGGQSSRTIFPTCSISWWSPWRRDSGSRRDSSVWRRKPSNPTPASPPN